MKLQSTITAPQKKLKILLVELTSIYQRKEVNKMKPEKTFLILLILVIASSMIYGQRIFRPIDPNNGGARYGKSPYSGPPFLYFGSNSYNYKIADSLYNYHLSYVDAAFTSWNNAGQVQFSRTSSGLTLTAQAQDYNSWGPAWSYPSWNGSTYELTPVSGSIVLNSSGNVTWSHTEQHLNATPHVLDVQSMVVHEAGHIHGLAHPLTDSYTHDATAPTMAGGDNAYFDNTLDVRSLETEDVYGTQFLQLRVPNLYSSLNNAVSIANAIGVGYVYVDGSCTLTGNISIPSGVTLTLLPGANVNFNGYYIEPTGGTFNIQNGSTVYLTNGDNKYYGLFTSIQSAINYASSGQTVQLQARTYNESASFSNKSNLILQGQGKRRHCIKQSNLSYQLKLYLH